MLPAQCNQRGMIHVTRGEHDQAIEQFHRAITFDPTVADYHANLGLTLLLRNDGAPADAREAIIALHAALHCNPHLPVVWGYLGAAYAAIGDDVKAIDYLLRGLAEPSIFVLRHLGLVYSRNGQFYEAQFYIEALLTIDPENQSAHFNRSLMLLTTGQFVEGWKEYAWRPREPFPIDRWRGENIEDKHLLLLGEAGIGDTLQFCRFIPDLAARCAKLSVLERPSLRQLLAPFGSTKVNICADFPLDVDCYMLTMDAGGLLNLDNGNVDRGIYVRAASQHDWVDRLAHLPRPRVGIVWAGQAIYRIDARRSLSLAMVESLFTIPVGWVSLQMDSIEACPIYDAAPFLTDWTDTADAIDALDLVISVDTAVAHLAGAMGKPVWLINRFDTCWRWGVSGTGTSWYPSMTIYRQPTVGDWSRVIDHVAHDLVDLGATYDVAPIPNQSSRP